MSRGKWRMCWFLLVLTGALALVGYLVSSPLRPIGNGIGDAWYYDAHAKQYFVDTTTRIAPFQSRWGNEAVRAHFFTCGDCTREEQFLGYYEKYTDEMKKELDDNSESFMNYEMAFKNRLYSTDGEKWVRAEYAEGIAIVSQVQKKCPPKKLRYCAANFGFGVQEEEQRARARSAAVAITWLLGLLATISLVRLIIGWSGKPAQRGGK